MHAGILAEDIPGAVAVMQVEVVTPEEFLGDVIGDVVTLTRADAVSRHVKLDVDIAGDLPPVRGDRAHLQQVLLNLVLNGMDAVNEANQEERRVRVTARPGGSRIVEVSVGDTGPGIPEDQQAIIFEPFVQTERGIQHAGGTGLGLPISKQIVEAHQGRLWVESAPGEGAAFFVTLPLAVSKEKKELARG